MFLSLHRTHMLFSKNRMSSEFSSELSSTINCASLPPGKDETSLEILQNIFLINCSSYYSVIVVLIKQWQTTPLHGVHLH